MRIADCGCRITSCWIPKCERERDHQCGRRQNRWTNVLVAGCHCRWGVWLKLGLGKVGVMKRCSTYLFLRIVDVVHWNNKGTKSQQNGQINSYHNILLCKTGQIPNCVKARPCYKADSCTTQLLPKIVACSLLTTWVLLCKSSTQLTYDNVAESYAWFACLVL